MNVFMLRRRMEPLRRIDQLDGRTARRGRIVAAGSARQAGWRGHKPARGGRLQQGNGQVAYYWNQCAHRLTLHGRIQFVEAGFRPLPGQCQGGNNGIAVRCWTIRSHDQHLRSAQSIGFSSSAEAVGRGLATEFFVWVGRKQVVCHCVKTCIKKVTI